MGSYKLAHSIAFGSNNWCLKFQPLYNHGLLTALSNGEVHSIDWRTGKPLQKFTVSEAPINALQVINGDYDTSTTFAAASAAEVKIFDTRSSECVATLQSENNTPFLSLDSRHGLLATGTELCGVDAEIQLYDVRDFSATVRSFIDSHHDDVTSISLHPSDSKIMLSGSTDGYTNIYDLTEPEEEDALHQVINFASIHSCGWLSPKRIYTLSHMETFAIHELNDKSKELTEPKPHEFGDVRQAWNCDYVVDIYPGYIAAGRSQQDMGHLSIIPFVDETPDIAHTITIQSAHSDEVVRDTLIPPNHSDMLYSCGEDGNVKIWQGAKIPLQISGEFWDYSDKMSLLDDDEPQKLHKKLKPTGKHDKSFKSSGKHRYKPY